ncbi:deleted in malignant brain tumors 1 protein-like isoform X2 [Simochromis diagramma]|uniref:deleted in malignant brain tumors 1 protein-like isoform X2 n=1 Tax=Simochromis diagramma TaxID=43689 RepID=UPI001A7EBA14|nr:deleted in malignant brain tumors 1 protein-like isoform X2 [Simochromis diagramma]XP_039882775.1 deleted in malignant brain tumors 1 protein-like isoform X2 [Simochromis diagramma]XP_039882776.1 deleted in malignant brain tumors 1 protein-like isoform X2 [Simochromis diagramma]
MDKPRGQHQRDMDQLVVVVLLLWSSGLQAKENYNSTEFVRLMGGVSRCTGTLELKNLGEWRPVDFSDFSLKTAAVVCEHLDCGSAVSAEARNESSARSVWRIKPDCVRHGAALRQCVVSRPTYSTVNLTCSDSVRLLNGSSLCSGRLEVKSNQSWSSVCEADFDQQNAEVVCRELGCGPPSVLQGALYGEVEAPVWSKEFQCGGHESALLDCRSSGSPRNSCSPGKAVGLTCSELRRVKLVGGASHCAGILEVSHLRKWRPVSHSYWTLKAAAVVCEHLDCGSAVSLEPELSGKSLWKIKQNCIKSGSALWECATSGFSSHILKLTCSDSVRLLNGSSLCSGRLEVKSNQSWSSVCEADFDQQDAEVVCRELSCGPPSVLQGALYGEVEAPVWSKEYQCGGHESALLDCRSSGSARNSCSPGKAVGLTCSEPVRLVGGASRCAGAMELKQGEWRAVSHSYWTLKEAVVVCEHLDCGSAVSVRAKSNSGTFLWRIKSDCVHSGSALRECATQSYILSSVLYLTCMDSVRLLNGSSLCSGRLEVKSNQSWSSVCEADFDQQNAEVVCRELGCGPPSVLQGALYGEVEAPVWSKEFQCGGHESALLDCRSSSSARNSCSSGKAVGLTCSEPFRLEGGASRCAGTLKVKILGHWRPVSYNDWNLKAAAILCEHLDCGSAVSVKLHKSSVNSVWRIKPDCFTSGSALWECATSDYSWHILNLTCSDSVRLLNGSSLCSGRLEVKSNQSWSSVCEADFDQEDAEVVCRELGCGPPSVLQGALYGEVEAPVWSKELQCGGHESALLDCRSSGSARNSCSPGKAVGLTCPEPNDVRLVGGASRCEGTLEVKNLGEWRPVHDFHWTLRDAVVLCEHLDCGFPVLLQRSQESSMKSVWKIKPDCVHSGSPLRECATSDYDISILNLACSHSVRLLNGSSLCSGRLEVKSDQSWSSVCEADFDQQDAEVVCRELGCGPPSVLQGALYEEVEAPVWSKEYQCGGHESALLDCRSSGSARNNCLPGKAVGLTCSEPFRLVGGANHCEGTVEVKQGGWRSVGSSDWSLKEAAAVCQHLDCGSAVSVGQRKVVSLRSMWRITPDCVHSGSAVRECARLNLFFYIQHLTCQDSVRLLNGSSLCSGRLEVKSNQSWSSVCEADFDQQDAEVVCRELGCGPPSVLQGALYEEVEAPVWSKEYQCGGHESALLDCRSSGSARNSCSPGKAVGLTCSEPDRIRLVGGHSHCEGILELKYLGDWKPVFVRHWNLKAAAVVCEHLGCGSAVSAQSEDSTEKNVWLIRPDCVKPGSALWECAKSGYSSNVLKVTCSGLQAEEKHNATEPDDVRLVGGANLCAGTVEVKHLGEWRPVEESDWTLKAAAVVCEHLDCGSAVSVEQRQKSLTLVWQLKPDCVQSGSALRDCVSSSLSFFVLDLTCSGKPIRQKYL